MFERPEDAAVGRAKVLAIGLRRAAYFGVQRGRQLHHVRGLLDGRHKVFSDHARQARPGKR